MSNWMFDFMEVLWWLGLFIVLWWILWCGLVTVCSLVNIYYLLSREATAILLWGHLGKWHNVAKKLPKLSKKDRKLCRVSGYEWKLHKIRQNLAESPLTLRIGNSSLEMMLGGAEYWVHHHYNGFTNNYHQKQVRTGGTLLGPIQALFPVIRYFLSLLARKFWPIRT